MEGRRGSSVSNEERRRTGSSERSGSRSTGDRMESRDRQSGLRTSRHSCGRSGDRVESRDRQSGQRGRSRTRSTDNNQGSGLEASMRNLFLKTSAFDESISEIDKLREEQERRIKEVVRMNKEEEARVARESKERLEKVKKENKRRAERMRHENKIRMVVILQENAALEDKLVAKLQEEDQGMKASKHIIKERAAPECPVSQRQFTSMSSLCLFVFRPLSYPEIYHVTLMIRCVWRR